MDDTGRRRKNGFTLIELIVVIAVLAIVAALAIPSFSGLEENAQERVCISNRQMIKRELMAEEGTQNRELTTAEVDALLAQHEVLCPAGGNVTVEYVDYGQYAISCSIHTDEISTVSAAELIRYRFSKIDLSAFNSSVNDRAGKLYFENYGWETVTVNGKTYFAKPYYLDGNDTKQLTIYANTISDFATNWTANLIYHDGVWYQYINKYGNPDSSISVANHTWEELNKNVMDDGAMLKPVEVQ